MRIFYGKYLLETPSKGCLSTEQKAFALMRRIKRARTPFLSLSLLSPFPTILYRWEKKKRRRRKESLSRIGQWNFSPFSGTGGEELSRRRFLQLGLEFSIPLLATVSTDRPIGNQIEQLLIPRYLKSLLFASIVVDNFLKKRIYVFVTIITLCN